MLVCPRCGKDNPEGFRFCGYCAEDLGSEPAPPSAQERKVVSILFCDVVGFTAASEKVDPEDVQARMQAYYSRLRSEIESYGGTVSKFIGDAVMAVFGVPTIHEDDAERAVRAGLRVIEAISELNEASPGLELSVRVGVNTGEVVVSSGADGEPTVLGDVVNTASRIQSSAPVGEVAVGEETYRTTERIFRWEELAPVQAKGKAEPIVVWRPLEATARFGSDVIRRLTTPLVGRETDFALLRGLFDRTLREREVQLVTLVGEPGVGKSRLMAELFSYIDALPDLVSWRQGRCLPYGEGITFWALSEIVKAHAGIFESDSVADATSKLEALLPSGDERPWFRARMLPLIGVETGQPPSREESFTAWRRFLEGIADEGPLVVIVEDIHWADDPFLEFVDHLANWSQGVPMLVVCVARPELYERRPTWGAGLANHTAVRLGPLSNAEVARLVAALLEQAVLPPETQQLILERAGGNPLYAEEFARMLVERDLLDESGGMRKNRKVVVPESLQGLIAARLDTLPGERKRLLQDAAVIGKVFWRGAVAAMGGWPPGEVEVALHELSRKELVRPSRQTSIEGEPEYGFWHVLVRDVAYAQISRAERAIRHLKAADWIENKAGERVEDLAEVLAYHTSTALDLAQATANIAVGEQALPRAQRFALLAGERAAGLDPDKALELLSRALDLTPEDHPDRARILTKWAAAALDSGQSQASSDAASEAVALARRNNDPEVLAPALIILGASQQDISGNPGVSYAEEAVEVLSQTPPGSAIVSAIADLSIMRMLSGDYSGAIVAADRALATAAELDLPPPGRALLSRAGARCGLGDAGGLVDGRKAIEVSVAVGAGNLAAGGYNNLGIDTLLFEGPEAALAVFEEGLAFAEPRGVHRAIRIIRASRIGVLPFVGRMTETIDEADRLIAELESSGDALSRMQADWPKCLVARERGAPDVQTAEEVLRVAGLSWVEMFIDGAAVAATTRLAVGDRAGAIALLEDLVEMDGLEESTEYSYLAPVIMRCALEAGALELASRLMARIERNTPLRQKSAETGEALLAEARGEHNDAARRFAAIATDWEAFGCRFEQAYALLGQGRAMAAANDIGLEAPLRHAREMFEQMGMRPRVDECDVLLAAVGESNA
jgi:class 3 adenylate cyclase/tetratricopeptide (TPR) repeat protein